MQVLGRVHGFGLQRQIRDPASQSEVTDWGPSNRTGRHQLGLRGRDEDGQGVDLDMGQGPGRGTV